MKHRVECSTATRVVILLLSSLTASSLARAYEIGLFRLSSG